ncbi:hypothetical protein CDO52_18265 [Nocardiopsis gilva YIM 90087]|uniref:EcsC family protein n=1 Tax=Nocardiopsis gilva YIM 90087 TaxID=1235441 RepID=A0A223S8S2_9ACTN|nr:hypothetical protein [Nocardiopsis gilva]ASU84489.1 hypothetical protein CDO52_18265 [Nocardiopsis gilva YIM 90087]
MPSASAEDGGTAAEAPPVPTENDDVGALVGRIITDDGTDPQRRAGLLGRLTRALADGARTAGVKGTATGRWITEVFTDDIAPRIPVRDRATLVRHHNGLDGEELADALVRSAAHATTTVGAAGGALAAVQFTAPPLLLTVPAQIVAETLVVAAIEVKLIAELHEVYATPVPDSGLRRASGYLSAWARKRGIDPLQVPESVAVALGTAAKAALRKRLMRLMGRHLTTLGPYLTGAVAGGTLNRMATFALGKAVRADLRGQAPAPAPPLPTGAGRQALTAPSAPDAGTALGA